MKIIIGYNKKNFTKKIKLVSSKIRSIFYKYYFRKNYQIISFINDRREEIKYNDIVLTISLYKDKQILKILKNDIY